MQPLEKNIIVSLKKRTARCDAPRFHKTLAVKSGGLEPAEDVAG